MWQWLIHILGLIAPKVAERMVQHWFNDERAAADREWDRRKWHKLGAYVERTPNKVDDQLYRYASIRYKLRTLPGRKSLETRAQEQLGWAFTHIAKIRASVENQPMPPEDVTACYKAIQECTETVRATLRILDEAK